MSELRTKGEHTEAIRRDRRVAVVVNTRSRRGRRHYFEVIEQIHNLGFEPLAELSVYNPKRLRDLLDTALATDPDLLIVGGGDGTLSSAVRHVAHRDVALGVLPLGTTNNFARSLGLPLDLAGAIRVFATGKVADIDLGMADDRPFANLASFGVSVEVAGKVKPWLKRVVGRPAYPLTALTILPNHRPFRAYITVEGSGTSCSPTSSTSPTAASTAAGRWPATSASTTACWWPTSSAPARSCACSARP
ncbi:diacylglycerol/lipid kinase family protein [Nonomuraea antimicrobica]